MPNYRYGPHAFGLADFQTLHEKRGDIIQWIREYSPMTHVSEDDPPIFMEYPSQKAPPVKGEEQADPTHSALLGVMLAEKLKEANVQHILTYPGRPHPQYRNSADFLIDRLKQ
jgi:hypothetical protein